MHSSENQPSFLIGIASGYLVAFLSAAYAVILITGLVTLPTPEDPIQNPWFTIMELLILVIAPAMVTFTVALHSWVPKENKPSAVLSIVFMSMCAVVTSCVHFSVLTLSRDPLFSTAEWAPIVFGFTWPSFAYALDILAWDVFFPLAALFAALSLRGEAKVRDAQFLFAAGAVVAFVGLAGVPLENMAIRNIGIIGYVLLFPWAGVLISNRLRSVKE
jgi:hypothetical protein